MRLAPRPRHQQLVLIGRPKKAHHLHFSIADESKREPGACPKRLRLRNTSSGAGTIPGPCRGCRIGSTRNRMPAYLLKCEGCGKFSFFLILEGQPPEFPQFLQSPPLPQALLIASLTPHCVPVTTSHSNH